MLFPGIPLSSVQSIQQLPSLVHTAKDLTGSSWQLSGFLVVIQLHKSLGGDYPTCQGVMYKTGIMDAGMSLSVFIYYCLQYVFLPEAWDL